MTTRNNTLQGILKRNSFLRKSTECYKYSMNDLKKLGKNYMDIIVEHINDNVNINKIAS